MHYFFDEMKCWGKNIVHGELAFTVIDMIFEDIIDKMFGPHYPNKVVPKLVTGHDGEAIVSDIIWDLFDSYVQV